MNRKELEISTKELREIMGISQGQVPQLEREGMPKVRRGVWHLPTVFQFCVARGDKRTNEPKDLTDQRKALYKAQTEKTEIENARNRRELVPLEEVSTLGFGLLAIYNAALRAVAPRVASQILPAHTEAETMRIVEDEINLAREAAADAFDAWPTKRG